MKKQFLFALAVMAALGSIVLFVFAGSGSSESLIEDDVESLSYSECIYTPGHNIGHCTQRVDGQGYSCVDPMWFQSKNCSSQIEK